MSRIHDPFPIPDHQGLTPTTAGGLRWQAIADQLVHQSLKLAPQETVLLCADPYFGGAALDAVRTAIQEARGVELATLLHWTPAVSALRQQNGRSTDPTTDRAEAAAMRKLFGLADAFILLMNDRRSKRRTLAGGMIEPIVEDWKGRAVHLHWFHDPADENPGTAVNLALDRMYERSIVDLNHAELGRMMRALATRMAGREIRLTDPRGSDLRFRAPTHFHTNYGDASRERMASLTSGRDREEELPAGSFRLLPEPDSARGVVVIPAVKDGESPYLGRGFDCGHFAAKGLRFIYEGGRVTSVNTGGDQRALDAAWAAETGDKDRIGEMIIGCNPLLRPVPGSSFHPQYGFGDGVVRLILGDNVLSGGPHVSSFHRWLMLGDASVSVEGEAIVTDGRLVFR